MPPSDPTARLGTQVMLAIDDSESMGESHSSALAFEALTLISKALARLEVGELGIVSFGDRVTLLHPFAQPFSDQSGAQVLQQVGGVGVCGVLCKSHYVCKCVRTCVCACSGVRVSYAGRVSFHVIRKHVHAYQHWFTEYNSRGPLHSSRSSKRTRTLRTCWRRALGRCRPAPRPRTSRSASCSSSSRTVCERTRVFACGGACLPLCCLCECFGTRRCACVFTCTCVHVVCVCLCAL